LSQEGNVYRQELATGKQLEYSPAPPELSFGEVTLQTAAISASPELVATVVDGEVTIEELPDREVVGRIGTSDRAQVAFVGDRLLIQREEGPLEIWDLHGTALQRTLPGDENYTWQPVANPDGTVVVRRRSDGTIVVDDLVTGARLGTFATRATSVFNRTGIAFSSDGSSIVGVSELPNDYKKGELVIRDISDEALVEAACEAAGRDLTAAEWRAFVGGVDPPGDLSCR
jgi:WD40 repeat protein